MQLEGFRDRLHRHGASLDRWPAAEAAAARALLAGSAEARAALGRAQRLDAAIGASLPPLEPARLEQMRQGLAARVARMPLPEAPTAAGRLLARLRPALPVGCGALATLAACGLWLTLVQPLDALPAGAADPLAATEVLALAEAVP
ncbi:hypothetical protein [Roseomonas elaeocarpi]|uniref:DUF3619 domain-containing protein n=1 Tax=Roseomonas elaeocarpi TaxID=907779 RepID=A0ABV6JYH6_9PROT